MGEKNGLTVSQLLRMSPPRPHLSSVSNPLSLYPGWLIDVPAMGHNNPYESIVGMDGRNPAPVGRWFIPV